MNNRIDKINAEIQKALSEIIAYEIKNPHINGIITVSKAETTSDLDVCKVYVSIFASSDDKLDVFNQIKHSARFIRKELGVKVKLRKVPYLDFRLDEGQEYTDKINSVIDKLETERNEKEQKENDEQI